MRSEGDPWSLFQASSGGSEPPVSSVSTIAPRSAGITSRISSNSARPGKELSREAKVRLGWMDFCRRTQNVARTCRHFGISRQTFYRWQRVSTSMVGRIVGQLKRHGRLREPPRSGVDRRALCARPYAIRKPKQYAVSRPGDIVQVDTLDVSHLPGIIFTQFTARDVVSRCD